MVWRAMIDRCKNKNNPRFLKYGGRGILVCTEWESFECFKKDMYEEYIKHTNNNDTTQLDRANNDKGYSKENCRWVTSKENANNRGVSDKQKIFYGLSPDGKLYDIINMIEFSKEHNLIQSSISRCLSGKFKQHKCWKFNYCKELLINIQEEGMR